MPSNTTRRRIIEAGAGLVLVSSVPGTSVAADMTDEETDDHVDETGDDPAQAGVRAAHLSPDAPDVDVYVDGDPVLENVPYTTVSEYLDLPAGSYSVQITPAGEEPADAVLDETVDVADGDYTIGAIGELAGENQPLQALVLEDDNTEVAADTARVRIVHASPDAPAVDVTAGVDGDALFENVAFGESGYTEVPAGEYTLAIYPAGERDAPAFEVDVALESGTVYSAFAVGYLTPEDAPANEPFDVVLVEDAVPDEPEDIDEPKDENHEDEKSDEPKDENHEDEKSDEPKDEKETYC